VPGILMAIVLMFVSWLYAVRSGHPRGPKPSASQILKATRASLWGLFMPVVIIGSIRFGIATPTEASVVAVLYSLFVGMVVYGSIGWKDLPGIFRETGITTGIVVLMIAAATLYGLIITREQIPQTLARMMLELTSNPYIVLLLILALYLVAGMLLDLGANIIILVPVLWPLVKSLSIDPIQFGIITVLGLAIGLITPPVGASLFVTCGIAKTNLMAGSREAIQFILGLIFLAVLIIFFPIIATGFVPAK
jgi:C4-dicarboxylate transporter DctM subunit